MITKEQIDKLDTMLKRIFALPISRMTLREMQNAISTVIPEKQDVAQALYESLLAGEIQGSLKTKNEAPLNSLVGAYSAHSRIAREVAEKGEFMNSFSCEPFRQGNQVYFINRMRRIDGQEYHFLSSPDINLRLARMFIQRLNELKGMGAQFDSRIKDEIANIKKDLDLLLK